MRIYFLQVPKSMLAVAFHENETISFATTNIWILSLEKGQAIV